MKLRLTAGFSESERIELGTLEYTGEKYIWNANEEEQDEKYKYLIAGFYMVSGLVKSGAQESEKLFGFFRERIPNNRKSVYFKEMLQEFGLDEYIEWEYVVDSGLQICLLYTSDAADE